jgi:hypothetical protein
VLLVLLERRGLNHLDEVTELGPMDVTIVLVSDTGDIVLTSDPLDITHLAAAAGRGMRVVEC